MRQQHEMQPGLKLQFEISYLVIAQVTVIKSRGTTIRLEALALVKTYDVVREGFWEADKLFQLGRRIVEVENGMTVDDPTN